MGRGREEIDLGWVCWNSFGWIVYFFFGLKFERQDRDASKNARSETKVLRELERVQSGFETALFPFVPCFSHRAL